MTETIHLGLPFIEGSQAQKHVTHNEALRALDALVMLAVLDRDLASPPLGPADGDRYIVKAPGSGGFAGKDHQIAVCDGGVWTFHAPRPGWTCYVADEAALVVYDGSAWQIATGSVLQNLTRLGIGTTADATNPLAAKLNNALFAARTVAEGGDGHLRYKLSKESAGKTLSFLFQDNYSGRAEFGLTGDDDFHVKVSPDGSSWIDAMTIDRNDGRATVRGLKDATTHAPIGSMLFTPGGDGTVSLWRVDASSGQNPRTATLSAVSGDLLTLSSAVASTFFYDTYMNGVSYIRIWNTSKTPNQSAWVKAQPAADQLRVLNATAIAGWTSGETIQVGDPTAVTPNRVMALDISPMLRNLFGTEFRQAGLIVKGGIISTTALDNIALSANGATGSFFTSAQTYVTGAFNGSAVTLIPCSELSPVSNSNLVFVRETIAATATNRLISSSALFV